MAHLLEYLVVGDRTCSITNRQIRCKFILTVILILDFLLHVDKWNTWAHVNDPPRRGYSHLLKSAFFQEKMPWKETYISEKYRVWGFQNRSYLNPSWSSWPFRGLRRKGGHEVLLQLWSFIFQVSPWNLFIQTRGAKHFCIKVTKIFCLWKYGLCLLRLL